jgi:hypothetical protein
MAGYNLNFGNPAGYADWTKYAGFDPNVPITGGISPPSMNQGVAPSMADVQQRATDVWDQLKQGNIGQAAQTYQFGKSMAKTQKPTFPVDDGMVAEHQE